MDNPFQPYRILSLDGGGSKGIYTLGVLNELEKHLNKSLDEYFDLVYGTSTGAIIAAGIRLGWNTEHLINFYQENIPKIMSKNTASSRSKALKAVLEDSSVFGDKTFSSFSKPLGIVASNLNTKHPLIFKTDLSLAHKGKASFEAGFGCTIAQAVLASCSAMPFFKTPKIETKTRGIIHLADGGFVANNPSFFAAIDAHRALNKNLDQIKILNVGTGSYHEKIKKRKLMELFKYYYASEHLSSQFDMSSNTATIQFQLFAGKQTFLRISEASVSIKTSLLEDDRETLDQILRHGKDSFIKHENEIKQFFE